MTTGIKNLLEPTDELKSCDPKIYRYGKPVMMMWGGSSKLIDRFVKELAEYSGEPVDWHIVAGRANILTTGDVKKVKEALRRIRLYFSEDL